MRLLIFGPGYTASRLISRLAPRGWRIATVTEEDFADTARTAFEIAHATHILSSVPPGEDDPVLATYAPQLAATGAWLGYISSAGVYGDTNGAWVDESAPVGGGRRSARAEADSEWLRLGARVFRLPGIYGRARCALDRIPALRVDAPGQVFSRIHVDDAVEGIIAGFDGAPGAYNLADDMPAAQSEVIAFAAMLLGRAPPPLIPLAQADLSPVSRAFFSENRRVANGKARRLLGWRPRYRDYRLGLRALSAMTSPASTSAAPPAASHVQR